MTVITQLSISRREWGGEPDRRLPIGMWFMTEQTIGDVSGGRLEINAVFQEANAPTLDGNMYSLEQLAISKAESIAEIATVRTFNLGTETGEFSMGVQISPAAGQTLAVSRGFDLEGLRRTFLGSATAQGFTSVLAVAVSNVNGAVLVVEAQGYIWGSRSRSVLGGPRKPPQGLWSNG